MPAFAGVTSREEPLDLGDITKNSWALSGYLSPGEVQHYKFTIDKATTAASPNTERFYMGLYVPGAGVPGFRYYVAIFGLGENLECDRWGDGWGRRRELAEAPAADLAHDTHSHGRALAHPRLPVHRHTSDDTTWLAPSDALLPVEVEGPPEEVMPVDYHNTAERLIFIADEVLAVALDRPPRLLGLHRCPLACMLTARFDTRALPTGDRPPDQVRALLAHPLPPARLVHRSLPPQRRVPHRRLVICSRRAFR